MMHRKKIVLALCCICAVLVTAQSFADTLVVDNTGAAPGSYLTIQLAIDDSTPGDTILLTAGQTFTGDGNTGIIIDSTELTFGKTGVAADPIIDMQETTSFLSIQSTATVSINNLFIVNGSSDYGAIHNMGTLHAFMCTFTNNYTAAVESANTIYNDTDAIVTCSICSFIANSSDDSGAIKNLGTLLVYDCTFSNNSANSGGALFNAGTATITHNCLFDSNSARFGGAINNKGGTINISDYCTFSNNRTVSTKPRGGAIVTSYSDEAPGILMISDCLFTDNKAITLPTRYATAGFGGALYNLGSTVTLTNCVFNHNESSGGGAVYNRYAEPQKYTAAASHTMYSYNCTFSNNIAAGGGAINNIDDTLYLTDCSFLNNQAAIGGAIANQCRDAESSIVNATNCLFNNNSANTQGGTIYNAGDEEGETILNANGCIFDGNAAAALGGVLYNGDKDRGDNPLPGTSIFECCRFVDNSATTSADALYNFLGTVTAQNCWWATNDPEAIADELFYGAVDYEPWIQMSFNVGPLALGQPTLGQADLTVTFSPSCIPDGTPVAFSITSGTIVPEEGTTLNGTVTAHAYGFEGTQTVCAIAEPNSETPFKLCKTIQEDSQPLAPANVIGRQQMHRFPRCADLVNVITWQAAEGGAPAAYYEIFAAPNLDTPIATINANARLYFAQHQRKPHVIYTYYLYAVTAEGVRSEPVKIILP